MINMIKCFVWPVMSPVGIFGMGSISTDLVVLHQSSAKNGQGLPSVGRERLKKLVRERGRRMRKIKIATLNAGSMTGRSGEIAQLMRKKSL